MFVLFLTAVLSHLLAWAEPFLGRFPPVVFSTLIASFLALAIPQNCRRLVFEGDGLSRLKILEVFILILVAVLLLIFSILPEPGNRILDSSPHDESPRSAS